MSSLLSLPHFDTVSYARSRLTHGLDQGETAAPVESTDGFSSGNFCVIGVLGREKTECMKMGTPAGGALVLPSGVQYGHQTGDPVFETPYDAIAVFRATGSTEPSDDSFELLGAIPADFEAIYTQYEDTSPPANAWYKWKYKNTASGALSSLSSRAIQADTDVLYASPQEVLADLGIGGDAEKVRAILKSVCDLIDAECERGGRLYYKTVTEVLDMELDNYVYQLKQHPVVSVSTLEYRDSSGAWTADTRTVHTYDRHIELDTPFHANRRKGIRVTYTAGFFDADNIPAFLNMFVRDLACQMYLQKQAKRDPTVSSKKLGNAAWTYRDVDVNAFYDQIAKSQVVQKYGIDFAFGGLEGKFKVAHDADLIFP